MISTRTILAAVAFLASASGASAGEQAITLDEEALDFSELRSFEYREIGGRQALCLDGVAMVRDQTLADGAITVDVAATGQRQFANLIFRGESARNHEAALLRLHKSRLPDAVQYTPVLDREVNWQLFGHAQASADFGGVEWISLRVDVAGDQARVSVMGADSVDLEIPNLTLGRDANRIGLSSLRGACFSNFRIETRDSQPLGLSSVADSLPEGAITQWSLSPSSLFDQFTDEAPSAQHDWVPASTEDNGTLLMSRYRDKALSGSFERNSIDMVHAGVHLDSETDQLAVLEFDVSDQAKIFLNVAPILEVDNSFRAKGLSFRGDFEASAQRLYLPLNAGRNTLVFSVADRANGWGLAARLVNPDGVEVSPLHD